MGHETAIITITIIIIIIINCAFVQTVRAIMISVTVIIMLSMNSLFVQRQKNTHTTQTYIHTNTHTIQYNVMCIDLHI